MTHLQYWLRVRGNSAFGLARELGIPRDAIAHLARPGSTARPYCSIRFDILTAVFEATGIRPGVLIEDALGVGEQINVENAA